MIWNILKLMFSKWLSIKRWNNFPRVEDITPLDNAWFVIHISLFMASLEEGKWVKIDKEYIIKKIIFELFKALVLSDINSGTRDYILKTNPVIMQKLEGRVLDYLLKMDGPEFLKKDIETILLDKSDRIENRIIQSAKKFAGHQECVINARVFLYAYDVALSEINSYFDKNKDKLYSLKQLLKSDNYKNYLSHIRRLSHAMRWSWRQRKYPVSVMSHLVIVTFISYLLANLENKDYDIFNIMIKSVYHDIPEAITWDIITPIKNSVPGFRETLEKVEEKMMDDYFFVYVSEDYKKEIWEYMLDPFSWEAWKLAKNADIISALLESKIERDSNNEEFSSIYRNIKSIVNSHNTYSSDYFLKDVLLSFWNDLEELKIEKIGQ